MRQHYRPTTRPSSSRSELGVRALSPDTGHLKDPNSSPAHSVTTPAEDDGVNAPGQDPLEKYLTLVLVKEPADEEVHQAQRSYHLVAYKTKESQLRLCEITSPLAGEVGPLAGRAGRVGGLGLTKPPR